MAADLKKSLRGNSLGYVFCFYPKVNPYGPAAAEAILDALASVNFSGRCEYYAADNPFGDGYRVGVSFRFLDSNQKTTRKWWSAFIDAVVGGCTQSGELEFDRQQSEFTELFSIRASLFSRGAVEFSEGLPKSVLDDLEDDGSWFTGEVNHRIETKSV